MPSSERRAHAWAEWLRSSAKRLIQASERGDICTIARLLDRRGDVNARDVDGSTAIHVASEEGHTAVLSLLIDRGADLHAQNNYQDTALHSAARRGQLATTHLLITRGADVRARNRFGTTPCEWAQRDRQGQWLATLVTLHIAFAWTLKQSCCRCHDSSRPKDAKDVSPARTRSDHPAAPAPFAPSVVVLV